MDSKTTQRDVPHNLQKHHSSASLLTVEDNIILCGEALLIPLSKYDDTLPHLHEGHIEALLNAKNVNYWPGLCKDVEYFIAVF